MTLPILYSFRRCPFAMRARMALLVSETICEIREVKLSSKPAEMLVASPKGTVPVLLPPDGPVLDESLDIMRWALGRNDPEDWLAGDSPTLIAANDGPFKHHLDRYKYPNRYGADPAPHRAAGMDFLASLNDRLSYSQNLLRESRSFADIAIMPFVRQFAETDRSFFDRQPVPALQAWLARHIGSDLFTGAMLRLDRWTPGDAVVFFPRSGAG